MKHTTDERNDVIDTLNEAIVEQAFHWVTVLENKNCSSSEREMFVRWIKKSPAHIKEFFLVAATWNSLDKIRKLNQNLVANILAEQGDSRNVVPLGSTIQADNTAAKSSTHRFSHWFSTRPFSSMAAAACLVCMVAITSSWLLGVMESNTLTYATNVGEQKSFTLEDGSTVDLNTMSRVEVTYSDKRRLVELISGEALFRVEHDKERPFYVQTSDAIVRAVGTSFNVYRHENGEHSTIVTVVEGKVAVSTTAKKDFDLPMISVSSTESRPEYILSAGAQLTVGQASGRVEKTVSNDAVKIATAWRQRKLVFRSITLNEAVQEFNRYNRQKLIVRSDAAGAREISGVFDANKPSTLIDFLEKDNSIKITRVYDKVIISDRPGSLDQPLISTKMVEP